MQHRVDIFAAEVGLAYSAMTVDGGPHSKKYWVGWLVVVMVHHRLLSVGPLKGDWAVLLARLDANYLWH